METYVIKTTETEINVSQILTKIDGYSLYFQPIIQHTPTPLLQKGTHVYYIVEKESRKLSPIIPPQYHKDAAEYLEETVKILLANGIYNPITHHTVQFDITNKIPIITDFKKAITITKWQDKGEFLKKYHDDIENLFHK